MTNSSPRLTDKLNAGEQLRRRMPKVASSRRQLGLLKWFVPVGLVLLVVAYELGPSRWIYNSLGFTYHLLVEIMLFGTVGPLLAFVILELLGRWIAERETADLQAQLLAQASEKDQQVRQVGDDTLQILFATSLLITTIKSDQSGLPTTTAAQIEITEQALGEAIQRVRSQLLN